MEHRFVAAPFLAAAILTFAGCSAASMPQGATPTARTTAQGPAPLGTIVNVVIPSDASSPADRSVQFVSAGIKGIEIDVYTSPRSKNTTVIGTSATDVSPGSAACGGAYGARTCSVSVSAPVGTDDFVITAYRSPPSSGSSPFSASDILSVGVASSQSIQANASNSLTVALQGVIATFALTPIGYTPQSTSKQSYAFFVPAEDAAGDVIVNGTGDPYDNPISVSIIESGGSGYTLVGLDGGVVGRTSVTLSSSNDYATVYYAGGSPNGYSATVSAQATGVAATTVATITPVFVPTVSAPITIPNAVGRRR